MVSKIAEKVPGWVGRFLIPEIERVVDQRILMLRETMDAKFKAVDAKFEAIDARFESMDAKFDAKFNGLEKEVLSLRNEMNARFSSIDTRLNEIEKRIDVVQRVAVLEAQVKELRERQA